jgi:hypothetical protein
MAESQRDQVVALRAAFSGPTGDKALRFLQERFFFYESAHVPGDPYTSAVNEGARTVVTYIMQTISPKNLNRIQKAIEAAREQEAFEEQNYE